MISSSPQVHLHGQYWGSRIWRAICPRERISTEEVSESWGQACLLGGRRRGVHIGVDPLGALIYHAWLPQSGLHFLWVLSRQEPQQRTPAYL